MGAQFSAALASREAEKVRDELAKKYGSLDEAARQAKPRLSYSTLRSVLQKGAKDRTVAYTTILSFESLGVTRERLLSL